MSHPIFFYLSGIQMFILISPFPYFLKKSKSSFFFSLALFIVRLSPFSCLNVLKLQPGIRHPVVLLPFLPPCIAMPVLPLVFLKYHSYFWSSFTGVVRMWHSFLFQSNNPSSNASLLNYRIVIRKLYFTGFRYVAANLDNQFRSRKSHRQSSLFRIL